VAEAGSGEVRALLADGMAATSRLSAVELASALSRRCREGAFSAGERDRALAAVHRDFATFLTVELTSEITAAAIALLTRRPLRAADSVQLASCLVLQELLGMPCLFVCADGRLAAAARQEGLATAP
jgi:uncharacterized protein